MRSIRKNSLFVSALLLLTPVAALAAGLGKLSVLSGLGEPLKAEIDVVAIQPNESDALSARVSSPDAFRQAGVDYSAVMTQIRANVVKRGDRFVVTLATTQPVEEPYLDVLLELNSPTGKLVRQYTFLLDPAGYKSPQPAVVPPVVVAPKAEPQVEARPLPAPTVAETPKAPAEKAPAKSEAQTKSAPVAKPEKKAAEAKPAAKPEPKAAEAKAPAAPASKAPEGGYQVKDGDTLSEIAAAHKPADVSLEQMLVAIQRANEDAFINKNINLVRSGRILRIPDAAEAAKLTQDEAVKVVDTQAKEFSDYRNKLATQVAAAPAPTGEKTEQKASGKIVTKPAEKAPAEAPKDQVRLSKPDPAKGNGTGKGPSADDLAAREKALREAQERVTELERNVKDLQTVVELKNKQLAELQKQQAAAAAAAAAAAKKPEPVKAPEAPKVETPKAPEPAKAAEPEKLPELPKAVEPAPAPAPEPAKPAEAPVAVTPEATPPAPPAPEPAPVAKTPTPAPLPAPAPQAEPSVLDMLTDNPLLLGGGLAAVLALLGLLAWRRKQSAGLNNSLIGATTTDSSSVFGTTGGRSVDTGSHSMQTDFSQSALGSIDTDEVDPIAEADVYMAYGRDAQAEEILKEALQKDPSRQAVRLKLLEIYAGRQDIKAFETTAGEIYAVTGGTGPEWSKAAELGRGIDPNNPMYGPGEATAPGKSATPFAAAPLVAEAPTTVAPPPPADLSQPLFDLDLGKGNNAQAAPDLQLESHRQDAEPALDIDLNLTGPDTARGEAETVDFSPSGTFIMDDSTKKAVSEMVANAPPSAPAEDLAIDFELPDSGAPATGGASPMATTNVIDLDFKVDEVREVAAVDLTGVNLDLTEDSESHWQEVATKLDLAKAYEEMGDKDGARELLNEVLKEGDTAQQDQARTMLGAMR